jgi:hypothetical protein
MPLCIAREGPFAIVSWLICVLLNFSSYLSFYRSKKMDVDEYFSRVYIKLCEVDSAKVAVQPFFPQQYRAPEDAKDDEVFKIQGRRGKWYSDTRKNSRLVLDRQDRITGLEVRRVVYKTKNMMDENGDCKYLF